MTVPAVGPKHELQIAIVAALNARAELTPLIGTRIYQTPPSSKNWPGNYVTVGEAQTVDDSAQDLDANLIYPALHVWTRGAGHELKAEQIATAIWRALHNASITLTENRFFSLLFESSNTMPDPDGVTKHIALRFRARTETPAA